MERGGPSFTGKPAVDGTAIRPCGTTGDSGAASCSGRHEPNWTSQNLPASMRRNGSWSLEQFQLREQIHKGSVSRVHAAIDLQSGTPVALKQYLKRKLNALSRHAISREIQLHLCMEHEHIIRLYAAWEDDTAIYLVQELATGGDLFQVVRNRDGEEPANEAKVVQDYMHPFLSALKYIHSKGISHRDIKPENILLTADNMLKLADFGLAINTNEERPVTRAGTLQYMAPEVLVCPEKSMPEENKERKELAYTCQVDVWAGGVLAYELLLGHTPFGKEPRQLSPEYVLNVIDKQPELPFWMSKDAKSFIKATLCKDPIIRPTAKQLLKHPWIKMHCSTRRRTSSICGRPVEDYLAMPDSPGGPESPQDSSLEPTPLAAHAIHPPGHLPSLSIHSPSLSPHSSHLPPLHLGHAQSPSSLEFAATAVLPQNGVLSDDSLLTGMVGRALSYASCQNGAHGPGVLSRNTSTPCDADTPRGLLDGPKAEHHVDHVPGPSSANGGSASIIGNVPFGRHRLTNLLSKVVKGSPNPLASGIPSPPGVVTAHFGRSSVERDEHPAPVVLRSASRDRPDRDEGAWRDRTQSMAAASPKSLYGLPKSRSTSHAAPRVPTPRIAGQESAGALQRMHRSSGSSPHGSNWEVLTSPGNSGPLAKPGMLPSSPGSRSPGSANKHLLPLAASSAVGTSRVPSSRKPGSYAR